MYGLRAICSFTTVSTRADCRTLVHVFVSLALLAGAGRAVAASASGLHPEAPPETEQFAFIVGEWDCATRSMQPDQTFKEGTAKWTGYYILNGWAIQDDWVSFGADGKEYHGTNIRSFNPKNRKWDNRWLAQGPQLRRR